MRESRPSRGEAGGDRLIEARDVLGIGAAKEGERKEEGDSCRSHIYQNGARQIDIDSRQCSTTRETAGLFRAEINFSSKNLASHCVSIT